MIQTIKTPATDQTNEFNLISKRLKIGVQLNTDQKLYTYWFKQLINPVNRDLSVIDVFNKVNNLYKETFNYNQGRYKSFDEFMNTTKKH